MNFHVQSQASLRFLLTLGGPWIQAEKFLPLGKCQFNWRSKTSMWGPVRAATSCYQLPPGPPGGVGQGAEVPEPRVSHSPCVHGSVALPGNHAGQAGHSQLPAPSVASEWPEEAGLFWHLPPLSWSPSSPAALHSGANSVLLPPPGTLAARLGVGGCLHFSPQQGLP